MSVYTEDHAGAVEDIREAGVAVTFTRTASGYDDSTGLVTPSSTTRAGYAIRARGNPQRYQQLGLIMSTHPTLLFAPATLDAVATTLPQSGDTVEWESLTHTVKDVSPVALDGTGILARVIVGR